MANKLVSFVTGGASGLGKATAAWLAKRGANVIIADLPTSQGSQVADELGDNVIFQPVDVTDAGDVSAAIVAGKSTFGEINSLVSCAGIAIAAKTLGNDGTAHALEIFSKIIQVNLIGSFNCIRLLAEHMANNMPNSDGCRGVIVNIASVTAFDGPMDLAAYSASKGGVVGMTLPVARDLSRYGIRVNSVAPGWFATPMVEVPDEIKAALAKTVPFPSRLGHPDELAQLVESIIVNPMMNGETVRLDGALRMKSMEFI